MLYKLKQYGIQGNFFKLSKACMQMLSFVSSLMAISQRVLVLILVLSKVVSLVQSYLTFFINDISSISDASYDPVSINDEKISCLMYADDIVLLSTSDKGLQTSLNYLYSYLMKWNLVLNTDRTKVIVF